MTKIWPPEPPDVIAVRLSGSEHAVLGLADELAGTVEVITRHGPRRNRRSPGIRLYLTVRIPPKEDLP